MKKVLMLLIALITSVVLVACGGEENNIENNNQSEDSTTEENETQKTEDDVEKDAAEEEEESTENTTPGGNKVGDVISNEAGDSTLVSLTNDVGTFESGPIKLTIEKANGVSMAVSDEYADLFESDQIEYIQVDMTVENTSDEHISFYASQATMTTSTGEQIESDMLLSDHIDGEFLGAVTKSGSSFYILENSKAEDVESIKLFFDAAIDENWNEVGEKIEIEIPLNK